MKLVNFLKWKTNYKKKYFSAPPSIDWDAAGRKLDELEAFLDIGFAEFVFSASSNAEIAHETEKILKETKTQSEVILRPIRNGIGAHNVTASEAREILDELVVVLKDAYEMVFELSRGLTNRHIHMIIIYVTGGYEDYEWELLQILGGETTTAGR